MNSVLALIRQHYPNFMRTPPPPVHHCEHAPCKDGVHHTSYGLWVQKYRNPLLFWTTGKVAPFPSANYELTTDKHQKEVRDELAKHGYELVV